MTAVPASAPATPSPDPQAISELPVPDPRRWNYFAIALVGPFLGIADYFIVNVSIPTIKRSLLATDAQIELIVAGYGLAFAVCLITGGRLGDIFGRRRAFSLGLATFTLTSALCCFAPSATTLVLWRFVQGATAAVMFPQALAFAQVLFTGRERHTAYSLYGVAVGAAQIVGQIAGGLLLDADLFNLGWRTVFLINVPIGLAALLAARKLPESKSANAKRLDLPGVAVGSLALLLLTYPLIEGRQRGWPLWSFVLLAASLPAFILFARLEKWIARRYGEDAPLLNPALLRQRSFVATLGVMLVYFSGHVSMLLMMPLYFQISLNFSATKAALTLIPFGIAFVIGSSVSGALTSRIGRTALHIGSSLIAAGLITMLALQHAHVPLGALFAASLLIYGFGRGLVSAPLFHMALSNIPHAYAGAASGVASTVQQLANSAGIAAIGTILFSVLPPNATPDDYAHAFALSCAINLALLLLASFFVLFIPRSKTPADHPLPEDPLPTDAG